MAELDDPTDDTADPQPATEHPTRGVEDVRAERVRVQQLLRRSGLSAEEKRAAQVRILELMAEEATFATPDDDRAADTFFAAVDARRPSRPLFRHPTGEAEA
jgi:hypothetical protein